MYMAHFQCDWVIWHAVSLSIWLLSCLLVPSMWFLWKILHHVGGMMCDNRMTFKTGVVKWTWHCREPQSHYVIITCSQHMEYIHTICPVTTIWRKITHTITHTRTNLQLMEEILHHLRWLKPYKQWDNHYPWWCRMSSINSITTTTTCGFQCTGPVWKPILVGFNHHLSVSIFNIFTQSARWQQCEEQWHTPSHTHTQTYQNNNYLWFP